MILHNLISKNKNEPIFWPKFGLILGGIHAISVGVLLSLREIYYGLVGLELPHPRLYGDMAAWFLVVIGVWLIWAGVKLPQAQELWIIPIGSAVGRMVYFMMALVGWLFGITHVIYFFLSLTDVFFAMVQIWATIRLRSLNSNSNNPKKEKATETVETTSEGLVPFPS